MTERQIAAQALRLSVKQRARLARDLLDSLEEARDAGVQEAWLDEAERRYEAYRQGKVKARPAGEAIRRARSRIA